MALAYAVEAPQVGIVRRNDPIPHDELKQREERRQAWLATKHSPLYTRDLSGRANGTIDPWYGCYLNAELYDSKLPTK